LSDWRAPGSVREGERVAAPAPTVVLRLFASAREAAGTGRVEVAGTTVGEVLDQVRARFEPPFAEVVDRSRIWVNGEPADAATPLRSGDEVAILPPVSGGALA